MGAKVVNEYPLQDLELPMLGDLLAPLVEKFREKNGAHYDRVTELIERIGQLGLRLDVGAPAADFVLPNEEGILTSLHDIYSSGPTVLVFLRGGWCPYCDAQVAALAKWYPEFRKMGVNIAVLTPEVGGRAQELAKKHNTAFPVLCDIDSLAALSYGCLYYLPTEEQDFLKSIGFDMSKIYGNASWFMPVSTSFLIDNNCEVISRFGPADPRKRPEPGAILAQIETLKLNVPDH